MMMTQTNQQENLDFESLAKDFLKANGNLGYTQLQAEVGNLLDDRNHTKEKLNKAVTRFNRFYKGFTFVKCVFSGVGIIAKVSIAVLVYHWTPKTESARKTSSDSNWDATMIGVAVAAWAGVVVCGTVWRIAHNDHCKLQVKDAMNAIRKGDASMKARLSEFKDPNILNTLLITREERIDVKYVPNEEFLIRLFKYLTNPTMSSVIAANPIGGVATWVMKRTVTVPAEPEIVERNSHGPIATTWQFITGSVTKLVSKNVIPPIMAFFVTFDVIELVNACSILLSRSERSESTVIKDYIKTLDKEIDRLQKFRDAITDHIARK